MDEKEFLRLSNDENLICESQTIESNNSVVFFYFKERPAIKCQEKLKNNLS